MIVSEIFPQQGVLGEFSLEEPIDLIRWYPKVRGFRYNFVLSNVSEAKENSDNFTNALDRTLLRFIRSQSDLIITTGKTARQENLRASVYAPLLIITQSSTSMNIPALLEQSVMPVYVTQKLENDFPNAKAIAIGTFQDPVPAFTVRFCMSNTFDYVVVEAGQTTANQFTSLSLFHEINLTVTRVSSEVEAHKSAHDFLESIGFQNAKLVQLLNAEGTWFFRFGA